MDLWKAIENRYSVRDFDSSVDVSPRDVERLLAAAIRAPSAGNRQPWHFYIVRDPSMRGELAAAALDQEFISQAPVVIVVCADAEQSAQRYRERGRELYCLQDTAAATEHILLGAVALGLGGCWVGAFDENEASLVLNLPGHHRPVAILPIGKPSSEVPWPTRREPLDTVVSYVGRT